MIQVKILIRIVVNSQIIWNAEMIVNSILAVMRVDRSSALLGVPNGHKKLARTPSLAVKTTTTAETASPVMDWLHYQQPPSMPTLSVNTKMAAMAVDSTGPLSPQGSVSSSGSGGSDGHNDDVTASHGTANDPTGMKGTNINYF